jgi:hypothetical protein
MSGTGNLDPTGLSYMAGMAMTNTSRRWNVVYFIPNEQLKGGSNRAVFVAITASRLVHPAIRW